MQNKVRDIYIFIGPPGAGKGSLAEKCVEAFSWCQLSTGNVCRHHIALQTAIGKQIDFAIKSGKLVSDSLIIEMVAEWFGEHLDTANAVILDGFPRTAQQAEVFSTLIRDKYPFITERIIRLDIVDDVVVQRLCNRFICDNKSCQSVYSLAQDATSLAPEKAGVCDRCGSVLIRRKDDEEATVRERLAGYHKHERALLDHYAKAGKEVVSLLVDRPIDVVFDEFKSLVGLKS